MTSPLLETRQLKKYYTSSVLWKKAQVQALNGVSLSLQKGQTLAVVGESGCGKSTLAKVLMQLEKPTAGDMSIEGESFKQVDYSDWRKKIQMVFQDPYGSLNPRKKIEDIIAEPLKINTTLSKEQRRTEVLKWVERVGLRPESLNRYPHMFSGGQRQRIGLARSLVLHPQILICDEPVSALDISIQAQVLNLLMKLQDELELSYLFISHDLSVVRHIADHVMVMYLGRVAEYGPREIIFERPQHPYTQALLASRPQIRSRIQKAEPLRGELPSPMNPPPGCAFHKRCPRATSICSQQRPSIVQQGEHQVACHHMG